MGQATGSNPSDHRDWAAGAPLPPRRGTECEHVRTSVPDPGRKLLTTMVLPRAGKGASMTLLMRGCTSAGEMPRRFSTSSKICEDRKQLAVPMSGHRALFQMTWACPGD